jgi:hypothetical protein
MVGCGEWDVGVRCYVVGGRFQVLRTEEGGIAMSNEQRAMREDGGKWDVGRLGSISAKEI